MKIGVTCVGAFIDTELALEAFKPWAAYKTHQIELAAVHGIFPSVWGSGKTVEDDKKTIEFFNDCYDKGILNKVEFVKEPTLEKDLRNVALSLLLQDVDIFLIVDLDEQWTIKQIDSFIRFVENTPQFDWYKINYRNFVFDRNHYYLGFNPPRAFRKFRQDGVKLVGFYHDNDVFYQDQKIDKDVAHCIIPSNIVLVDHYSWSDKDLCKQKIAHHNKHYSHSSFKWNEEKDCLEFNLEYYQKLGQLPPTVYKL